MVMEATAAPEQDTAPVAEAPPQETAPETATGDQGPETVAAAAPETEPKAPSLDDLPEEELFAHPKVKERLAKETESVRRRSERETEQRIQADRSKWVGSRQAFRDIHGAIESGNAEQAEAYLHAALNNRDWVAVDTIDRIGKAKLPEGKVSTEDLNRLDDARMAVQRGTGSLEDYADVLIEVRAKAYAENVLAPVQEKRIERDFRKRQQDAAKTAQIKAAEETAAGQGHPTVGIPGKGGERLVLNSREIDAIPTRTWLNLAKDVQERLSKERHEGDRQNAGRLDKDLIARVLGR